MSGLGTNTLTLTFTGSTWVEAGSLADGVWTLAADLTRVRNASGAAGTGAATSDRPPASCGFCQPARPLGLFSLGLNLDHFRRAVDLALARWSYGDGQRAWIIPPACSLGSFFRHTDLDQIGESLLWTFPRGSWTLLHTPSLWTRDLFWHPYLKKSIQRVSVIYGIAEVGLSSLTLDISTSLLDFPRSKYPVDFPNLRSSPSSSSPGAGSV